MPNPLTLFKAQGHTQDAPADVMAEDTGAFPSIFICPSTGTNMGTGPVLNSPPAKWPYQPKVLQVHTPLPYPPPRLCSWGAWQCFPIPYKLTDAPLLFPCSGLDAAGLGLDHCIHLAGICPSLPATLSLSVTPGSPPRDTGTGASTPLHPPRPGRVMCRAPMGQGAAPHCCALPPTRAPSPTTSRGPGGAVNHCQTRVHSWAL